jgi:hypothetical protein
MSIGREECCWEQRSKEGRTHECQRAEGVPLWATFKRGKDINVNWQIVLLLVGAMFKRGKDRRVSIGGKSCH